MATVTRTLCFIGKINQTELQLVKKCEPYLNTILLNLKLIDDSRSMSLVSNMMFLFTHTYKFADYIDLSMGDDAPIFWERKTKLAEFLIHQLPSYPIAVGHFE